MCLCQLLGCQLAKGVWSQSLRVSTFITIVNSTLSSSSLLSSLLSCHHYHHLRYCHRHRWVLFINAAITWAGGRLYPGLRYFLNHFVVVECLVFVCGAERWRKQRMERIFVNTAPWHFASAIIWSLFNIITELVNSLLVDHLCDHKQLLDDHWSSLWSKKFHLCQAKAGFQSLSVSPSPFLTTASVLRPKIIFCTVQYEKNVMLSLFFLPMWLRLSTLEWSRTKTSTLVWHYITVWCVYNDNNDYNFHADHRRTKCW